MRKTASTNRLNKKLGPSGSELTVKTLIERLQKLPGDLPVYCGNQQAAIGIEVREGRIGQDYYGTTFRPFIDGKHKGVFLTAWSEDAGGEVYPCIYTG